MLLLIDVGLRDTICDLLLLGVGVCSIISYLPQLVKLIQTKRSEDLSISSWILWVVSSSCYMLYSLLIGGMMLILSSLIDWFLTMMILFFSIRYRCYNKEVNDG